MRVALFATCLGDQLYADAVGDAVRVLRSLGADVTVPADQTCCGQPAWNSGYTREARAVALHTIRALAGNDPVVTPSGSCAAMIRVSYPRLLAEGPEAEEARALAARTWELSQFIVDRLGVTDLGRGLEGRRVAYHHGCHALRELGTRSQPLSLLLGAGAEIVPWPAQEECCGFGGTFSVKLPHVSVGMADRKLETLPTCDVLTSADAGCLMQLSGRAARTGRRVETRHLACLLREAVDGAP